MDRITIAGSALAALTMIFLILIISQNTFPIIGLKDQSQRFNPDSSNVGFEDSYFMWANLDTALAGQAFVIFAAAAGCLAMLRTDQAETRE